MHEIFFLSWSTKNSSLDNIFLLWLMKKILLIVWSLLVICWLLLPWLFGWFITWSIYNTSLQEIKSDYRFFRSNDNNQKYIYTLTIPIKYTTKRVFTLYPNDCITSLTINNKEFPALTGDLCNYRNGVKLDIGDYLIKGDNTLTLTINQNGGSKALLIKPSIDDPVRTANFIILGVWLFLILIGSFWSYFVFKNKKNTWIFRSIVWLMYIIGQIYLLRSEYFQRSHDLTGHLDYIKLLLRWERMPKSDDCRQCYHSNIYYWISEGVYRISWILWRADPFEVVRRLTSVWRWIGILFWLRTLYEIFYVRKGSFVLFAFSAWLFAFRPTQFYYGPRITNDVWHYMFTFISIYYGLKARYAYQDNDTKAIHTNTTRGFFYCLIGLIIKSNSIVRLPLTVVWMCFGFVQYWSREWREKARATFYKTIVQLFIAACVIFWWLLWMSDYKGINGIVDNADRLNAGNSVAYIPVYEAFSTFYPKEFINNTTMRDEETDYERRSFWWFLSKTMITGEMGVVGEKNLIFYHYFMILSLIVIVHSIVRVLSSKLYQKEYNWYLLFGFVVPVVAMMCYRIIYPLAASMHYRYIHPHLIFVVAFTLVQLIPSKKISSSESSSESWLSLIDIAILGALILFVIMSIAFSFPPYF